LTSPRASNAGAFVSAISAPAATPVAECFIATRVRSMRFSPRMGCALGRATAVLVVAVT
jgi:hypothetical protein